MRVLILVFLLFQIQSFSFGQKKGHQLYKAYKKNSSQLLQKFISEWQKETKNLADFSVNVKDDTTMALIGLLNYYYSDSSNRNYYFFSQAKVNFSIVDYLDGDTLLKRIIYGVTRKNKDSVYKKALIDSTLKQRYLYYDYYNYSKNLFSKSVLIPYSVIDIYKKRLLPLNKEYFETFLNFLFENGTLNQVEQNKRLNFVQSKIFIQTGKRGYIRIKKDIFCINGCFSITIDSKFENAIISCSTFSGHYDEVLKKVNGKWIFLRYQNEAEI
jgi:hypothetical protein